MEKTKWLVLVFAWTLSLIATMGTLFFSEVMKLPPCSLCWYQRIAMYPLLVILTVGILTHDSKVTRYAAPFTILGLLLSGYHNLLYYGIIPEALTPCTQGVSCSSRQIEWWGFITIPLLSLIGFSLLGVSLITFSRKSKESSK